jgi:hypothetical protein
MRSSALLAAVAGAHLAQMSKKVMVISSFAVFAV